MHGQILVALRAEMPADSSRADARMGARSEFHDRYVALFDSHFTRLFRYFDRLSGEPDLAADLAQEAFIKLYERQAMPDRPEAWLISVAMNLFRNARATRGRRRRLLTVARGAHAHADPPPTPDQALASEEIRCRVRETIDRMPERERRLLLLQAEGFSYREIAAGLGLHEASIGTLLARARDQFRELYGDADAY
jgi:RNA polymerase sigma-70 factor, ECF subfamily